MRNLLSSLLLIMVTACSNDVNDIDERKDWGLKGPVKSVMEKRYEVEKKFGKWEHGQLDYYGHNRVIFAEDGLHQETEYFGFQMEFEGKIIPTRESNKIIEEIYYDAEGKLKNTTKKNYVANEKIETECYDSEGVKISVGEDIRKEGRIIKSTASTFKDGVVNNTLIFTSEYNEDGNVIAEQTTNGSGGAMYSVKYEYLEFDDNNNWIKRLQYENGSDEPTTMSIREIEYYK